MRKKFTGNTGSLSVASHRRRPPIAIAEQLAFPICTSERAWRDASRQGGTKPSKLEGIDKPLIEVVRRHQPFRKFRSRHALARLRTYNDLDKHRRPNIVLFAPGDLGIGYEEQPGCRVLSFEPYRLGRVLRVGTKLALIGVVSSGKVGPCVGVHFRGSVKATLDRGILIEDLLAKVIVEARRIVTECEAVL